MASPVIVHGVNNVLAAGNTLDVPGRGVKRKKNFIKDKNRRPLKRQKLESSVESVQVRELVQHESMPRPLSLTPNPTTDGLVRPVAQKKKVDDRTLTALLSALSISPVMSSSAHSASSSQSSAFHSIRK